MPTQAEQVFNIAWRFRGNVAPQLDRMAKSATHTQHVMDNAGRSFQQADRQMGKLQGTLQSTVGALERITSATQRYAKHAHTAYDATTALVGAAGGQHAMRANNLLHKHNLKTSLGYLAVTRAIDKKYRPAFGKLMKGYDLFNKGQVKLHGLLDKTDDAFVALNETLTRGTSKTLGFLQERWDKFVSSVTEAGDLGASFHFGDTLIETQKQVKLTGKDLENLTDVANKLGVAVGKNREMYVEALGPLIKYGITSKDMLMAVGKATSELEVVAGIPMQVATMAFAKLAKTMDDLKPEDVTELTRSLAVLGQAGGTTTAQLIGNFEDLGTYLLQIPKDAQKASIGSFAAIAAAAEREMIPTEQIKDLLTNIVNINEDAIKSSANLGVTLSTLTGRAFDFGKSWEMMRAGRPDVLVNQLAEAMGNLNVQQSPKYQQFLTQIERNLGISKDTLIRLGKAYRSGALDIEGFRKQFIEAGKNGKQFNDMLAVQNASVDRLRERVGAAADVLKSQFTDVLERMTRPILIEISNKLSDFVGWLEKGSEGLRTFKTLIVVAFGGTVLASITALIGMTAALTVAVGGLNFALVHLGKTGLGKGMSDALAGQLSKFGKLDKFWKIVPRKINGIDRSFVKLEPGIARATLALLNQRKGFLMWLGPAALWNKAVKGMNMLGFAKSAKAANETVKQTAERIAKTPGVMNALGKGLEKVAGGIKYVGLALWGLTKMIYGPLLKGFMLMLTPVKLIITGLKYLGAAAVTALGPVGVAIAAVGTALVGIYYLLTKAPESVQKSVASFLDGFGEILISIPEYFEKGMGMLLDGLTKYFSLILDLALDFSGTIGKMTGKSGNTFQDSFVKFVGRLFASIIKLGIQFFIILPIKLGKVLYVGAVKLTWALIAGLGNLIYYGFYNLLVRPFTALMEWLRTKFYKGTVTALTSAVGGGANRAAAAGQKSLRKLGERSFWEKYIKQPIADYFTDMGIEIVAWWDLVILDLKRGWEQFWVDIGWTSDQEFSKQMKKLHDEEVAINSRLKQDLAALAAERERVRVREEGLQIAKEEAGLGKDQLSDEQKRLQAQRAWTGRAQIDLKAMRAAGVSMRQGAAVNEPFVRNAKGDVAKGGRSIVSPFGGARARAESGGAVEALAKEMGLAGGAAPAALASKEYQGGVDPFGRPAPPPEKPRVPLPAGVRVGAGVLRSAVATAETPGTLDRLAEELGAKQPATIPPAMIAAMTKIAQTAEEHTNMFRAMLEALLKTADSNESMAEDSKKQQTGLLGAAVKAITSGKMPDLNHFVGGARNAKP